ncbi:MAG: transporter substrate-binding domain-containing protein [Actinomycetota bacterium]
MLVLVSVLALVATACGDDDPDEAGGGDTGATGATGTTTGATGETATGGDDLLARIQEEGVIRVSTDPAYPPQSSLNEETGEYEGFDIDVAKEIASRLGVEIQWETPAWDLMTAGHWNDRWDMSVGSMTVTPERAEVLHFSTAYYYTPAAVAVHVDNTTITDLETDLDGMRVGVCGACTYDFFLQGTLEIPGYEFDFIVDDPEIVTYDTDTTAIQDLSLGDGARLDAVISALPTLERAIDKDRPIKIVGDPVFAEPLAVAFDQSSELDAQSLVDAVSAIVEEMHADGTLTELSMTWFGTDLTIEA